LEGLHACILGKCKKPGAQKPPQGGSAGRWAQPLCTAGMQAVSSTCAAIGAGAYSTVYFPGISLTSPHAPAVDRVSKVFDRDNGSMHCLAEWCRARLVGRLDPLRTFTVVMYGLGPLCPNPFTTVANDCVYQLSMAHGGLALGTSPVSLADMFAALGPLLLGLHTLHTAGLVHLDVKMNNLLYDPVAKKINLVDFGQMRTVTDPFLFHKPSTDFQYYLENHLAKQVLVDSEAFTTGEANMLATAAEEARTDRWSCSLADFTALYHGHMEYFIYPPEIRLYNHCHASAGAAGFSPSALAHCMHLYDVMCSWTFRKSWTRLTLAQHLLEKYGPGPYLDDLASLRYDSVLPQFQEFARKIDPARPDATKIDMYSLGATLLMVLSRSERTGGVTSLGVLNALMALVRLLLDLDPTTRPSALAAHAQHAHLRSALSKPDPVVADAC